MATPFKAQLSRLPKTYAVSECPLCGVHGKLFFPNLKDPRFGVPGVYSYQRCESCSTVFQSPMVLSEELPLCYPEEFYAAMKTGNADDGNSSVTNILEDKSEKNIQSDIRRALISSIQGVSQAGFIGKVGQLLSSSRTLRERAFFNLALDELLPRKENPGKVLEIGCGTGQTLITLKKLGWEVTGVEWNKNAASRARQNGKLEIYEGDFRKVDLPLENYQLIFLHHVFEHIDDPIGALLRIKSLLAPGGKVVLVTPNPASLGVKVHKDHWTGWDAPRHLVFLTPSAFERAANKAGLKVSKVRTLCRHKGWDFAKARAHCEGRVFDLNKPDVKIRDRLLYLFERAAINIGLNVGEEVIVILEKGELQ